MRVCDYPGEPPETPMPVCPVCGWEFEKLYLNRNGEVIGCDNEIDEVTVEQWEEDNGI